MPLPSGNRIMDEIARGRRAPTPVAITLPLVESDSVEVILIAALHSLARMYTFDSLPPAAKRRAALWLADQYPEAPL